MLPRLTSCSAQAWMVPGGRAGRVGVGGEGHELAINWLWRRLLLLLRPIFLARLGLRRSLGRPGPLRRLRRRPLLRLRGRAGGRAILWRHRERGEYLSTSGAAENLARNRAA